MKKIISLLAVITAVLFSFIVSPAVAVLAEQDSEEKLWSNMNTGAVQNNPPKEKEITLRDNAVLLTRISTYHWNNGKGAEPGTIYLYEGNKQIGSWKATGRSGSGVNNVHWDAKTNVVLYPDHTYTVKVSDNKSWSWNEASGNCGMFELYGLDPAPNSSSSGCDGFSLSDLSVYNNGKKIRLTDDKGSTLKPIIKDGTVYLPAESLMKTLGQDTKWDKNENAFYIGNVPDEEIPGHCWVLVNTTHDVRKNEQGNNRTWKYDYEDIENGGRYTIDYTFSFDKDYVHYVAIGECTDIPAYLLPNQYATLSLKTYATEFSDRSDVWGLLEMSQIQYDFVKGHYPSDYNKSWENVKEKEPSSYNCKYGDFEWKVKAKFPEGKPGETLEFSCKYHRGDLFPVTTTFTYEWRD